MAWILVMLYVLEWYFTVGVQSCGPKVKVTVQFETEGNGQNEIFRHMDGSEVKL